MKSKQSWSALLTFTLIGALLASCSGEGTSGGSKGAQPQSEGKKADGNVSEKKPDVASEPAEIVFYSNNGDPVESFDYKFGNSLRKKFPNYTIKYIMKGQGTNLPDLLAAGTRFDIFFQTIGNFENFAFGSDIQYDMTELIATRGVNLSRFEPTIIDAVKQASGGKLYALPITTTNLVLYYNKTIFDKFGVSYPQDGMTWEDVIELAKKVSRIESGVTYKGLDPDTIARLAMPLAITLVDAKTNRASINSDGWRTVFTLAKEIWSIPNNMPAKLNSFNSRNWFMQDQNIAMLPYNNLLNIGLEEATKNGLNWDLVQYPSFKGKPNLYAFVDAQIFSISQTSKYKEQAAQLLSVVTSNEVQLKSARTTARFSSLKDPAMKEALGADMPFLKGKNLKSIFKSTAPAAPAFSPYDSSDVRNISFKSFEEYMKGKDLNTALREAEEKINQWIETNKMK
jgi:multiple sugar transport system substrate-binding protein